MTETFEPKRNEKGERINNSGERIGKCLKVRRKKDAAVVLERKDGKWRKPTDLVRCGNGLACPMCAQDRARKACRQISAAIAKHRTVDRSMTCGWLR